MVNVKKWHRIRSTDFFNILLRSFWYKEFEWMWHMILAGRREGWQAWLAATWGRATDLNLPGRADYTFLSASYTPTGNTSLEKNSQCNFGFTLVTSGDIFFFWAKQCSYFDDPLLPPTPFDLLSFLLRPWVFPLTNYRCSTLTVSEKKKSFRANVGRQKVISDRSSAWDDLARKLDRHWNARRHEGLKVINLSSTLRRPRTNLCF